MKMRAGKNSHLGQGEGPVAYKTRQIASDNDSPEGWKE